MLWSCFAQGNDEIAVVIRNNSNLKWQIGCKRVVEGRTHCHLKYMLTTRPCSSGGINMLSVCMMAQKCICCNQCNRVCLATLSHSKSIGECKLELHSGNAQSGSQLAIFCPMSLWSLMDVLENNRVHYRPCASFQKHRWIQKLESQSKIAQFGSKSVIFLSRVTLKFDETLIKKIGHLCYTISSFVHHFTAIGEFKLELQSGDAQFGSKSAIFVPCDLQIWLMTLKNNRAPLLTLCIIS